jgi:hypothetical protein
MPKAKKSTRQSLYVDGSPSTKNSEAAPPADDDTTTTDADACWPYRTRRQVALYYTLPASSQKWSSDCYSAGIRCTPSYLDTDKTKADSVVQGLVQRLYSSGNGVSGQVGSPAFWAEELTKLLREEGLSGDVRRYERVSDARLRDEAEGNSAGDESSVGAKASSWSMDIVRHAPKKEPYGGLEP